LDTDTDIETHTQTHRETRTEGDECKRRSRDWSGGQAMVIHDLTHGIR
jgi:hypothetical protein